ncbi:MAG TPA: hypothetical protein VK400_08270 [Pyrinomonadaceae bacterium]|nr:hypothetical protein [Pyrinomonadaceae bacterium]
MRNKNLLRVFRHLSFAQIRTRKNPALVGAIFVLMFGFSLAAKAQEDSGEPEPVCGSVERFNQTGRWQDLPGCTGERDYENPVADATLLGRAKDAFKDFFEAWETGEVDRAESHAGGCLGYMNGADAEWNSNPALVKAKPAYERMKKTVEQYLKWKPLVGDLFQDYVKTMTWIDESAKSGDLDDAETAVRFAGDLRKTIAEAQRQNVPDSFLIPGSGEIKAATVGEIKTRLAAVTRQADGSMENAVAVDNAKWEPYTKFLSGDRLRYFNETYRIGTNVYGRGGKYLDKPEQFDAAPVMCTRTSGRSGIYETWKATCYSFQGDKKVGGARVKSGYGSAPNSAFN